MLSREQVVSLLKKKQGARTGKAFAAEIGISESYLSEIYKGTRDPGSSVAEYLKLEKVPAYVEVAS